MFDHRNPRPEIEIYVDRVLIDGVVVWRPGRLSAMQWIEFWEKVQLIGRAR